MFSRNTLLVSTALVAIALPGTALAQEETAAATAQASAATADEAQEGQGEMIVVTATKRAEPILDIPQSVTVVGGDTLERQHATTFQDYLSQIPGLSLEQDNPGEGRLVLRGVNTGGVSSTVAVYVDETPFGSSTGLVNGAVLAGDFDTFDIDRVEVLRGPQGTLYGASSLGGVLKFVTTAPKLGTFGARGRAGIEFVDGGGTGYNFSGMVNAPLGDIAAFRGSGFYRKDAGWINAQGEDANFLGVPSLDGEDINESKVWGGRGSILVKPTEELSVRLTAIGQHIESDAPNQVEVDSEDYDPIDGKFRQTVFFRQPNELDYRLYNGLVEYDFGWANLVSSTSFGKSDQEFTLDAVPILGMALNFLFGAIHPGFPPPFPPKLTDAFIAPFQDQETDLRKFTQEVRLASPSNDKFEWMAGVYYTHEEGKIDQFIGSVDYATGQSTGLSLLDTIATLRLDSDYKELAGFANVTWHVTDRFDIGGGGRLAKNDQSSRQVSASALGLVGTADISTESDESVFTYSISPRFELSDTTAVYGRIAKGYRPGGPNVVSPTAPATVPRTFDSDSLTSYEVGLKHDLGRRFSLDLAAYHLKWKDIQLITTVDLVNVNINGGTAASNGIEGSLNFRPMTGLQLGVNGAWIDAHLTSDTTPEVGGKDGDKLPWVPKLSFSLNTDYEWKLSDTATAFVGGTLAYTGKQRDNFVLFGAAPQRRIPDYAIIDLRAGVEFGRFTVDAYVKNLTNTEGVSSLAELRDQFLDTNLFPGDAIRASLSRPRTIGFSLTAGF